MKDYSNIELSIICPVFIQNDKINVFQEIIENYESYNPSLLSKVEFIFVDDCSPFSIKIDSKKLNFTIARVTDDIAWNQGGARNLGVSLSKSTKMILTDLDHIFPETLLEYLIKKKTPKNIYRIRRERAGKAIHSGANIFFCSKPTFYKSMGVDEEFCGHYGYEDVHFAKMQEALGTKFRKIRKLKVQLFEHKEDKNISHHFLNRDTSHNKEILDKKLKHINSSNPLAGHSRIHINFKWEIAQQNYNYKN